MKGEEGDRTEKEILQEIISDDKIECAGTHAFHWTEVGTGFATAWQVSTTFVRPTYQLLS